MDLNTDNRPTNLMNLETLLQIAEAGSYAVGSFSPRYVPLIRPVLRAGQGLKSPVIVQISQIEFERYGITPREFADEFFACLQSERITVPVTLHLDHSWDFSVIQDAIAAGFTSVMMDASKLPLQENIAATREVVRYARRYGVSVEGELGRIGTTDFVETDSDEELYTDPEEAQRFVAETQVDALAVSVGTAHGVYLVRKPRIDYERLEAIRRLTPVHLVLHGGSGVPAEMIHKAVALRNGGISKVNIATDLELAFLAAIGRTERLSNRECSQLPEAVITKGRQAVEETVRTKIREFVRSEGKAADR